MFHFLKIRQQKDQQRPSVAPRSLPPDSTAQRLNIKRELIQVVLKQTLRLHAIPFGWLACEVISIPRSPLEEELHIQLVMLKWNERLLQYAPALQQQLLLGLDRFDPSVDHSGYIFSWRFAPECGNPFTHMPEPKSWLKNTLLPIAEEPVPVLDRRHARRPAKGPLPGGEPSSGSEDQSSSFSSTLMAPLR